jgi:tetratricopeptide (TPR) repeat protein
MHHLVDVPVFTDTWAGRLHAYLSCRSHRLDDAARHDRRRDQRDGTAVNLLKASAYKRTNARNLEHWGSALKHSFDVIVKRFAMKGIGSLAILSACFFMQAAPSLADTDWDACKQRKDRDTNIAACTRIVEDAGESHENHAIAYLYRGIAYQRQTQAALRRVVVKAGLYRWSGDPIKAEDYDQALRDFDKALELNPKLVAAYANRGVAENGKNRYDDAIADFNRVIEVEPNSASTYANRGVAYYNKEQDDKAIADFSKAIELDPKIALGYYDRAFACASAGRYDCAIEDYSRVIELEPANVDAYYNRGHVYQAKADQMHAIRDYSRAIEIDPADSRAYNSLGGLYTDQGDYDRAITTFEGALKSAPGDALLLHDRGLAYSRKGDYERAIADFSLALKSLDPKQNGNLYYERGLAYYQKADYGHAIEDFDRAIDGNPRSKYTFRYRSRAHYQNGEYVAAINDYVESVFLP